MADQGQSGKKSGVPSWQIKQSETSTPEEAKKSDNETAAQDTTSRASILEQARKFLQEDEVRNSSTDKQVAFLEEKGLESHEIESLLGITRNAAATNAQPEVSLHKPWQNECLLTFSQPEMPSQITVKSPSLPQPSKPSSQPNMTRTGAPIITYPEFLTTPTQPPPLITAQRLLTTLYFFGGISALLYGTSNYLVAPMVASLTESRHNLALTAQSNLDKLISRLSEVVSEVPQSLSQGKESYKDNFSETDSDSDPTELFHRDIGVQTSIPTSPVGSRPGTPKPSSVLDEQTSRLAELSNKIKGLKEASSSEGDEVTELSSTIGVLKDYLDDLAYTPASFKYGGLASYGTTSSRATEESLDEIAKLKTQIRAVKGVLLSARSFPSGAAAARVK